MGLMFEVGVAELTAHHGVDDVLEVVVGAILALERRCPESGRRCQHWTTGVSWAVYGREDGTDRLALRVVEAMATLVPRETGLFWSVMVGVGELGRERRHGLESLESLESLASGEPLEAGQRDPSLLAELDSLLPSPPHRPLMRRGSLLERSGNQLPEAQRGAARVPRKTQKRRRCAESCLYPFHAPHDSCPTTSRTSRQIGPDNMAGDALSPADDVAADVTDGSASQPPAKKRRTGQSARGVANLTPEQLARKRANDREAQRAIRERTKNQIDALNRRIQDLESQQPYHDLQLVLREKDQVLTELQDVRKRLESIVSIASPALRGANGLSGT